MAEHPNVVVIRRIYEAFGQGDLVNALDGLAPECVFHFNGSGPLAGDHVGPEAIAASLIKGAEMTGGSLKLDILNIYADDLHGVVVLQESGSRPDGATLDVAEAHVLTFDDQGRITNFWDLPSDPDAHDRFFDGL
jgi:hypothetical protein